MNITAFLFFNMLNVVIQTIKSIATIKCGKTAAAIINALAYGFYTYIIVLMVCDLPLLTKCVSVGLCNLIGVYIVKLFEEKTAKDKIWKIEVTVPTASTETIIETLNTNGISNNYQLNENECYLNIYCNTKDQTKKVATILRNIEKCKYVVLENKATLF